MSATTFWPRCLVPNSNSAVRVYLALPDHWLKDPGLELTYLWFSPAEGAPPGAPPLTQHERTLTAQRWNAQRTRLCCQDTRTGEEVWLALWVYAGQPRWQQVLDGERGPRAQQWSTLDHVRLDTPGVGCPRWPGHTHLVEAPARPPPLRRAEWKRTEQIGQGSLIDVSDFVDVRSEPGLV